MQIGRCSYGGEAAIVRRIPKCLRLALNLISGFKEATRLVSQRSHLKCQFCFWPMNFDGGNAETGRTRNSVWNSKEELHWEKWKNWWNYHSIQSTWSAQYRRLSELLPSLWNSESESKASSDSHAALIWHPSWRLLHTERSICTRFAVNPLQMSTERFGWNVWKLITTKVPQLRHYYGTRELGNELWRELLVTHIRKICACILFNEPMGKRPF